MRDRPVVWWHDVAVIRPLLCAALGVLVAMGAASAGAQTAAPADTTLVLDVWVRDLQGQPVARVAPRDFVVQVDGRDTRVRTAQWIDYSAPDSSSSPLPGRSIAVVVDDLSFTRNETMPLGEAIAGWMERLHAADRVAVTQSSVNAGALSGDSADRSTTVARVRGALTPATPGGTTGELDQYERDGRTLAQAEAIARAVTWLAASPMPRVLVVISDGLAMSPDAARYLAPTYEIARDAGINSYFVVPAPAAAGAAGWASVPATGAVTPGAGVDQTAAGLLARILRVQTRPGDAFDDITRATSGVYRLSLDTPRANTLPHTIPVTVGVRPPALSVRAPRVVHPPAGLATPRSVEDRARDILAGVDVASDIPLDATTTVSGDAAGPQQVLLTVNVELPAELPPPVRLTFGLLDDSGTIRHGTTDVTGESTDGRQRTSVTIPVAPGWRRLTLVAEDGDGRLGSFSRGVHARLRTIGAFAAAEPRLLWRSDTTEWQLLDSDTVPDTAIAVASLFELYADTPAARPPALSLRLDDGTGREVASQTLTPTSQGDGWRLSGEVRITSLEPGTYTFRLDTSRIAADAPPLTVRLRKTSPATAPPPPPLPAAADVVNLFRAGVRDNWPRATPEDLLVPELLTPQLQGLAGPRSLPAAVLAATGDAWWTALAALAKQSGTVALAARGLTALHTGDARTAETHLRDVVSASPTSNEARRLLGLAFALAGRDDAATGVWSLAAGERGADTRWTLSFVEALGRTGDYRYALELLEGIPGAPAGRHLERLVEALIIVGRTNDATAALTMWEAGEGREQTGARLMFYLVALRFAAALAPAADAQAVAEFRRVADRYVAAGGEYAPIVTPWLQSAVALDRR